MSITDYIRRFLDWWLRELLALIPERWRQRIFLYPDRLLIEFSDRRIDIALYHGNSNALIDQRTVDRNDALAIAGIGPWLSRIKSDYIECTILAPAHRVLTKSLTLPMASDNDLRNIIGIEMDRQTPFTPEQVYYDLRITHRDPEQNRLNVDLYVATRDAIDSLLAEVRDWSITAHTVSFKNGDQPAGINLLPPAARAVAGGGTDRLTLAAIGGTLALFIAALYLPILHQQNAVTRLTGEINTTRKLAQEVQPLIAERAAILERAGFLAARRHERTPVIKVLAELTTALPDDTYLERLTLREQEIQILGESNNASSIVGLVEKSNFFSNPQPRAPVTKNPVTNKEKFHVATTLTPPAS